MIGTKLILVGTLISCLCLTLALVAITGSTVFAPDQMTGGWAQAERGGLAVKSNAAGCELGPVFPQTVLRWCEPIQRIAYSHNIKPDLVAALIWLESNGNPQAFSSSGAVGLMQVMPRDGLAKAFQCANGPCFHDRPTIQELSDPEFNITYGTQLLADLLARYGDLREALKAYGPMDVGYTYADRVMGIYVRAGD